MQTSRLHAVVAVVLTGVACGDSTSAPLTTWTANIGVAYETPAPTGSPTLAGTGTVTATGGGGGIGTLTYTVVLTGTPTAAISAMATAFESAGVRGTK